MELIEKVKKLENLINKKLKNNNVMVKITGRENEGTIIISKDKKIHRLFNIEIISLFQIRIKERNKIIEYELQLEELSKWIYNLYNPMEFAHEFFGGKLHKKVLTKEQINAISDGQTIDYSKEREKGITVPRKEFDNQPTVKGYLGPMYGGIGYGIIYLRYETQEMYDALST